MNSWMSVEPSACLPPLTMFNIGAGRETGAPPAKYRYRGRPALAALAWANAMDAPTMAFAPRRDLPGVPSSSIRARSTAACSPASLPIRTAVISPRTFSTARRTPSPPKRDWSPSRSSSASAVPLLAPEGTSARPTAPSEVRISTSTVGLPRESRTSLAFTSETTGNGSPSVVCIGLSHPVRGDAYADASRARPARIAFSTASAGPSAGIIEPSVVPLRASSHVSRATTGMPSPSACPISDNVP